MNLRRTWQILRKDLELGPRSPFFLWAIGIPVIATVLLQVVFGGLFAPKPRLAIVDHGSSEITRAYQVMDGFEVALIDDEERLRELVKQHRFDAGLVLPAGFDQAVRSGAKPSLQFYVAGESLASHRIVLAVTTIDLVRTVQGSSPPVEVNVLSLGAEDSLPISARLVPLVVMFALMVAGVFLPGTALVEEKEQRTLSALLVTPVRLSEVLVAKGSLGLILAVVMGVVTLALNGAVGASLGSLTAAMAIAALMCVEVGLIYGAVAKDMKSLFALIKGLNVFLIAPVVFYLFPNWPQWIPKVFPTYWVIQPIFELSIKGAALADVWLELVVALGICLVLGVAVFALVRRMERQLAIT